MALCFCRRNGTRFSWDGRLRSIALPANTGTNLFRRAGIGVGFDVAPLLVHHAAQLAFHDFEGVVHHFCQRIVRPVIDLFFFGHQLVTGRDGDVDSHPVLVSLFMGVIGLLNGNVAPADVIAEFVQAFGFLQYHLFNAEGFFQATIRDIYRQLHSGTIVICQARYAKLSRAQFPRRSYPRLAATTGNENLT